MVDNKPYYYDLPNFVQDIPAKSICMVPKRACDVMDTEVTRLLKLTANAVIPIRYTVPRKVRASRLECPLHRGDLHARFCLSHRLTRSTSFSSTADEIEVLR